HAALPAVPPADVFVIPASREQMAYAAQVAHRLRRAGLPTQLDVTARPLRGALAFANREGFRRVVVVGEAEARDGTLRLREMSDSAETTISLEDIGSLVLES
ncbi:MAG TPA: His/Gly/Thr/Pro-type tRNA ligase C-terminal domain-containing protein, partial [Chloroflexota bacterium]|nr:His/Gly/Thr/Pro-type tRNA ligase C-terminal domain-containing protein [Chloroflexota bacterium]